MVKARLRDESSCCFKNSLGAAPIKNGYLLIGRGKWMQKIHVFYTRANPC
jgi:hypothetical protein